MATRLQDAERLRASAAILDLQVPAHAAPNGAFALGVREEFDERRPVAHFELVRTLRAARGRAQSAGIMA